MLKKISRGISIFSILIGSIAFMDISQAQELNRDIRSDGLHYWNQTDFTTKDVFINHKEGVTISDVESEARSTGATLTRYSLSNDGNVISAVFSFNTSQDAYNYTLAGHSDPDPSGMAIPVVRCIANVSGSSGIVEGAKCRVECQANYDFGQTSNDKAKWGTIQNGQCK